MSIPSNKILIVDDDRTNHLIINKILSSLDVCLYNAHSGEECVELCENHHFCVILMDVLMPGMDGFETVQRFKNIDGMVYTPVIFITASDINTKVEYQGYHVGAVDFIYKPLRPQVLVSKVNTFLQLQNQKLKIEKEAQVNQQLRDRNALLLTAVGEGVLGVDLSGNITFANPVAVDMLFCDSKQLIGGSVLNYLCINDEKGFIDRWDHTPIFKKCLKGEKWRQDMGVFWKQQDQLFPAEYTATPIVQNGLFSGVVIVFQDISARRKLEEKLTNLAHSDTLTGLANRYLLLKLLNKSLARVRRDSINIAILFLDLDRFKKINDSLGHSAGDQVLVETAERLKKNTRSSDIVSRLGGDEFVIILDNIKQPRNAAIVAEKIIDSISRPYSIEGAEVYIGVSIGIVQHPHTSGDEEALLKYADIALYQAKIQGRKNFKFFTQEMQAEVEENLELENQLHRAIINDDFILHYQPVIRSETGELVAIEALIRWQKDANKIIPPNEFIPIAEESGVIESIGHWVMSKAYRYCQTLNQRVKTHSAISISINISPKQFGNTQFVEIIKQLLKQSGLAPSSICLEITESMMLGDIATACEALTKLHNLGLKIAIDDFGTGYSSLGLLQTLPIDIIKIDKSFIHSIESSAKSKAIIRTIISLAKNLKFFTVAEGVENAEQLNYLRDEKCDFLQGFIIARPMPEWELEEWINKYLSNSDKLSCGLVPTGFLENLHSTAENKKNNSKPHH